MRNADPTSPARANGAPASSRRTFLRGVAGLAGTGILAASALGGCDLFGGAGAEPGSHDLDALLLATVALGDRHEASMAAVPALQARLTPVRDAHRAHAQALARAAGTPVPRVTGAIAPPTTDPADVLAGLRQAEKAAQAEAITACLAAPARLAPLLGSIAAARASHQEVLA